MNNATTKTLLITTAVALRILSIANALRDTEVTDGERELIANAEFDSFKVEHVHAEEGKQALLCDRINDTLFSVSFVGSEKFLEQIGSQGWTNSTEALVNYLTDLNPEVQFSLEEFRCEEFGDQFIVYSMADEDQINQDDPALAKLFFGNLLSQAGAEIKAVLDYSVEPAAEEVLRATEDAVQTDVISEVEDAGSHAADHLTGEEDTDTAQVKDCRRRFMGFVRSPMGVAAAVVGVALVGVAAKLAVDHFTNGASEQLLG